MWKIYSNPDLHGVQVTLEILTEHQGVVQEGQVRPLNTRLIAREKVAGALQSPNPIRTNSNRPYFVTKAVFCLSLGLIRI
jgi:hypothetical protein